MSLNNDQKGVLLTDQKISFTSTRRESNYQKDVFIGHQMRVFADEQRIVTKVEKRGVQRQEKEVLETKGCIY